MVFYVDWANSNRCSCEDDVARLEREELADEAHQFIDSKEHVGRVTFLHLLAVTEQVEVQVLNVFPVVGEWHPFADGGTSVEAFAEVPGQSFLP